MIPLNPWVLLGGVSGVALACAISFGLGHHQKTLEDDAAALKASHKAVLTVSRASAATATVNQQTAVQQAHTADTTISNVQKVKLYVPPLADSRCIVGAGAIRLLDAAARNVVIPEPALGVPDADASVALSDIIQADVINAGAYHTLAERLKAWDDWYDAQAAIAR